MTSTGYDQPVYPTKSQVSNVVAFVNSTTLLNRQLVSICQINGLRSSGVKAELQRRIVERVIACSNDPVKFEEILLSIRNQSPGSALLADIKPRSQLQQLDLHNNSPAATLSYPSYQGYPSRPGMAVQGPGYMAGSHQSHNQSQNLNPRPQPGYAQFNIRTDQSPLPWPVPVLTAPAFIFKPSPFYEPKRLITELRILEPVPQNRNTVVFVLKGMDLQRHLTDPSLRVMVFSAADNTGVQDISFPYQAEIKVNSGDVKCNLRGLKNKPGSTRPVDITDLLRQKQANYENKVEFTYASTNKGGNHLKAEKFYLCIYVCKTYTVAALASSISKGNKISRASVVQEITRKARDAEIVTTSQKLSLKCPLSYMRLEVPVRSVTCKHIQCFDATSYLQLQEQGPQWICPICSSPAAFDQLAVDEYAREILLKTPKSTEQVTIEPDGEWRIQGAEQAPVRDQANGVSYVDDDEVIVSDVGYLGRHRSTATPNQSIALPSTPNTGASRESSSMPRSATASGAGSKRPAPVVVDLTLSDDDDDDEPRPPPKRHNPGNSNGWYQ